MDMETKSPEGSTVLTNLTPLLPEIAARAEEIEKLGAVPADIVNRLDAAGAFTMLIPPSYGGSDLRPAQFVQVLATLARVDASVGWTAMVSVGWNATLARFSPQMLKTVFTPPSNPLLRGAFAPKGIAEPVSGGYRVKGRWPFASGSYDYQWVTGNCMVMVGGKPRIGAHGGPDMLTVLVPKARAKFLDTWHSVGLRGSASHDFVIDEEFVPEIQTSNVLVSPAAFDTPIHRLPILMILGAPHAAVAIGIAEGAIDDLRAIAKSKVPALDPGRPLKDNPIFNYRFGEIVTRLDCARAFLARDAEITWEIANAGKVAAPAQSQTPLAMTTASTAGTVATPLQAQRALATAQFVQRECVDIVQIAFELAGSDACYSSSPLQRRWRDIRVLGQHTAAATGQLEKFGQMFLLAS
jgi:alkylation response protein AidB-like acyl-CoA dehydrogenase